MRAKLIICLIMTAAFVCACAACSKPAMPEPEEPFESYSDYDDWTEEEGYPEGELEPEGCDGLYQDRFSTRLSDPGYDSGRIAVGDSRCCQLGIYQRRAGAGEYAVFAAWGGHYLDEEPCLSTDRVYDAIEACFKNQIEKKGSCEIFFFATVNDYDYTGADNESGVNAAIAFAERLASMRCESGGREYAPVITIIGIAGAAEKDRGGSMGWEGFNGFIDEFNEMIEKAVRESPVLNESASRYTTVPEIMNGEVGFIDDGLHYDDETLNRLAEFIVK